MARKQQYSSKNIDGVTHIIPKKQRKFPRVTSGLRRAGSLGIAVLVIGLGVFTVGQLKGQPNLEDPAELKQVLARHIVVPNEQPVIATVTDTSALKTPFLRESKNGDKIIIYEKARRVVIYRPSLDRIVDIGPVELDNIPKN